MYETMAETIEVNFSKESQSQTRCKFLGRMVLDGPTFTRPSQSLIRSMISMIQKQAPSKNKKKVTFICDAIKLATVSPTASSKTIPIDTVSPRTTETLVARNEDDSEFCRIPLSDIVSIAGNKRIFLFITLDPRPMPNSTMGRFFVLAFKCHSSLQTHALTQALIQRTEEIRREDVHQTQPLRPLQAPTSTPQHNQSQSTLRTPPQLIDPVLERERLEMQDAIDHHNLSPMNTTIRRHLPETRQRTRLRPPRKRAVALQKQYGHAIKQVAIGSDKTMSPPNSSACRDINQENKTTSSVAMHDRYSISESPSSYNSVDSSLETSLRNLTLTHDVAKKPKRPLRESPILCSPSSKSIVTLFPASTAGSMTSLTTDGLKLPAAVEKTKRRLHVEVPADKHNDE